MPSELVPGQTVTVRLELRSIDKPVPKSTATLEVPAGWTVTPSRYDLRTVPRNGSTTVVFEVTPGPDGPYGELELTGRVTGRDWTATARATTSVFRETTFEESRTNVAVTDDANTNVGDFDGGRASLSAQALAGVGVVPGATTEHGGVRLKWPDVQPGTPDNVLAAGQVAQARGRGYQARIPGLGDLGARVRDGRRAVRRRDQAAVRASSPDWYGAPKPGGVAAIVMPYQNRPNNQRQNTPATIYFAEVALQAGKPVRSVELAQRERGRAIEHAGAACVRPRDRLRSRPTARGRRRVHTGAPGSAAYGVVVDSVKVTVGAVAAGAQRLRAADGLLERDRERVVARRPAPARLRRRDATGCASRNAPLVSVAGDALRVASPAVEVTVAVVDAVYSSSTPGVNAPKRRRRAERQRERGGHGAAGAAGRRRSRGPRWSTVTVVSALSWKPSLTRTLSE